MEVTSLQLNNRVHTACLCDGRGGFYSLLLSCFLWRAGLGINKALLTSKKMNFIGHFSFSVSLFLTIISYSLFVTSIMVDLV